MAQVIELIFSDYNIDNIARSKFSNFIDSIGDNEKDLSFVIYNLKKLVREYTYKDSEITINEKTSISIINTIKDELKKDKFNKSNQDYISNPYLNNYNNIEDINLSNVNNYLNKNNIGNNNTFKNTAKNKSFKAQLTKESDAYNEEEIKNRRLLNNENDTKLVTSLDNNNGTSLVSLGIKDLIKYEYIFFYLTYKLCLSLQKVGSI